MKLAIFLLLVVATVNAANSCINQNTYLAYLYRCHPEEFEEVLACVGSEEEWRPKLGSKLTCPKGKRIVVYFSAVEAVEEPTIVTCDRQPLTTPIKLEECVAECKLENVAGQCDSRFKCSLRLEEFFCSEHANLHNRTLTTSHFALRIQYICVDDAQRLEYLNEINYNADTICQYSTTTIIPSRETIFDSFLTYSTIEDKFLDAPAQSTITQSIDDSVLIKVDNSSLFLLNDAAWTATFLSRNVEKWVLYLLLGLLVGLVLVLLLLLVLCSCSYQTLGTKQKHIFNPNTHSLNVKTNRESQTLMDAPNFAPRMIRFQRDSTLDSKQPIGNNNDLPIHGNKQPTNQQLNVALNAEPTKSSAPTRGSLGWNRASDVPPSWPQAPIDLKTQQPPAVVISNNNIPTRQPITSSNSARQPITSKSSASSLNRRPADNRFVERDSVFENEPFLAPKHVWVRHSVQEGPEGINFYPSVSASPDK